MLSKMNKLFLFFFQRQFLEKTNFEVRKLIKLNVSAIMHKIIVPIVVLIKNIALENGYVSKNDCE